MSYSTYSAYTVLIGNSQIECRRSERLQHQGDDEGGEGKFMPLPDMVDQEFIFVGKMDGIEVATGFASLFAEVRKGKVYIKDTDQAL
ncbi:hypothetical protein BGW38_005629 [Lunasporangiospora selenospora]|uniref:Uncharacterized protein n=1 Tax=Lunasporangiospora selenospora TaxID=979761 RepID=A0A9P6FZI4_9FUNG|nr:hypothetical protein BGW38_005629 [Lunasporangiospora selenospora]